MFWGAQSQSIYIGWVHLTSQNPAAWKGSPGCDGLMEEQEKELEVATRDMIDESTGLPESLF